MIFMNHIYTLKANFHDQNILGLFSVRSATTGQDENFN